MTALMWVTLIYVIARVLYGAVYGETPKPNNRGRDEPGGDI